MRYNLLSHKCGTHYMINIDFPSNSNTYHLEVVCTIVNKIKKLLKSKKTTKIQDRKKENYQLTRVN